MGILESDLLRKESSFFGSINSTVVSNESIQIELSAIIRVIKDHNDFIEEFYEKKANSLKQILNHYVAEYLISENYIDKERHEKIASQKVSTCINKVIANNLKIIELESKLKDTVKGQEELNVNLEIFLNRNDIKIEIENSKFILKRGTFHATNLSEGEKTAIAFAYFLTELKSLKKENKLSNTIIFLDDPISSLDSNHIFQIRSLISHFFQKNEDYLQLFISTHNFEFFSIMLDCNIFKNVNRQETKEVNCPFYLIHRTNTDASTIKNLPKSLRSHKSEYAHLFHILNEYNALQDKENFEFNILLPNALRRFLELY